MSRLGDILEFNREFVDAKQYEQFRTDRFPDKQMVIVTCMDTRLIELLPRAMNLKNGDVKIIKAAGAVIAHPFGSIMRSILVAVFELGAKEVLVIGHHDCGMSGFKCASILQKALARGISEDILQSLEHAGIDLDRWLVGFEKVEESVTQSVRVVRNHPLLPKDVLVHGLLIHPETGKLDMVVDGSR